ncbi:MAG TPA: hypothetical protein ENK11_07195, partial [Phycisphaerales bacterium]|nr:hypothetical protein [Phycisphaerales bacterium]
MDAGKTVALVGCLLVGGCAGPLDRSWDDPIYRDIRSRYQHRDEAAARVSAESETPEPPERPLEGLGSLSVEDAIRVAINNAPSLRRAGYRVDLAAGRVTQAG